MKSAPLQTPACTALPCAAESQFHIKVRLHRVTAGLINKRNHQDSVIQIIKTLEGFLIRGLSLKRSDHSHRYRHSQESNPSVTELLDANHGILPGLAKEHRTQNRDITECQLPFCPSQHSWRLREERWLGTVGMQGGHLTEERWLGTVGMQGGHLGVRPFTIHH